VNCRVFCRPGPFCPAPPVLIIAWVAAMSRKRNLGGRLRAPWSHPSGTLDARPDGRSEVTAILSQAFHCIGEAYLHAAESLAGLTAAADTRGTGTTRPDSSPCETCEKKDHDCSEPCDRLRRLLPRLGSGRGRREFLVGLRDNVLGVFRVTSSDVHAMLLPVHHLFTQRQWQLVELTYRDGLSTREASRRLGISESAVRQRRQRIAKRISAMQARTYARRSEMEDAER